MNSGTCKSCGGPLYLRRCLGAHVASAVGRPTRTAHHDAAQVLGPRDRGLTELRWTSSYTTALGRPSYVAVWRAVRVTPLGHEVEVWRAGQRYPAEWDRRAA